MASMSPGYPTQPRLDSQWDAQSDNRNLALSKTTNPVVTFSGAKNGLRD